MFTYILIALVLITTVGALRAMTQEERSIAIKGATNVIAISTVYTAKAAKGTMKAAYTAGSIAGSHISLEQQEAINTVNDFNTEIKEEGGATKVAIKIANRHAEDLGLADYMKDMTIFRKDLEAKLAEARESRKA